MLMIPLFQRVSWVAPNYNDQLIPVSAGLMFLPGLSVAWLVLLVAGYRQVGTALTLAWGFALLGFLDDLGGQEEHGGFRRHIKNLVQGTLTTGGLKALGGGFLAVTAAMQLGRGWLPIILGALNIALSANLVNLLDLRPGRAIKSYLLLVIPFFFIISSVSLPIFRQLAAVGVPALAVIMVLAPYDLQSSVMLGDTGANLLGALAGLHFLIFNNVAVSILAFTVLAGLNYMAEKISFSQIIANSPVLTWFDRLGRPE